MLHGNPAITKEINAAMGGLRGGSDAYARIASRVKHYVSAKLDEMAAKHGGGRHAQSFGLSGAGSCVRKSVLAALGAEAEYTPGKLWQFFIGHYHEPVALALLEEIGFKVVEPQAEVTIPGDYDFPLFHSWTDGIIERNGERFALSVKTQGYKSSSLFRGKATRRGFTALPFEGMSESWRAQSQLEMYGLGLKKALIVVLAKDYMEVFEKEDPYCMELGSAVVWADIMEADPAWVEAFVLPTWKRAQRDLVEGRVPDGAILDKDSGLYRPTDPRRDNKKSGWDWDRCRWSTGQCDLRDACMAAYGTKAAVNE